MKSATHVPTSPPPTMSPTPALWTQYRVTWSFLTRVCASVPANPEIVKAWLDAWKPTTKPAGALSIEEINEEVLASLERGDDAPPEFSMLVFQRHAGQIVMRAGTVRAHIKDCARVLSAQFIGRIPKERAFSTRVINGVYPDEQVYWIPICREDGTVIREADGAYDKPIHTRGPQGVVNALKRFEYIEPPSQMTFTLKVLGRSISETDLHHILSYGGVHGYAGERGDGEGRYRYTLEKLDA